MKNKLYLIITILSMGIVACNNKSEMEISITALEASLSLKSPNGFKIADDIYELKSSFSSCREGDILPEDIQITDIKYLPVKEGYAAVVTFLTSEDQLGNFVKTNIPIENQEASLAFVRTKSSNETDIFDMGGWLITCFPYGGGCSSCVVGYEFTDKGQLDYWCECRNNGSGEDCAMRQTRG